MITWLKPLCLSLGLASLCTQQAQTQHRYKLDLNRVENDLLEVEMRLRPDFERKKEVWFHLPKIVPGTYSIYDFGRFVQDLKAFDAKGKELKVEKIDANSWKIKKAKNLDKITYKVEDTWDTKKKNVVFEPAGTNFDQAKVFVLNHHGILGFIKGEEQQALELSIGHPKTLFGGTSLERIKTEAELDVFRAGSYHDLVDAPIMYAPLDTAMLQIAETEVLIHTYSPTGRVKSKDLVGDIQPILEAQKRYLGGKLPVNRYAFLIFLNPEGESYLSGAAGALEHSYSSFYCLFEGESSGIAQMVRDVAAHEFFHIVTPLNIHSEEIHYFDFINPKMSEHLWLYEGVTEYLAQHVQVKEGLVDVAHFLKQMSDKMRDAEQYGSYSFTEFSKECLDKQKSKYNNVYLKGALIGMCIDLILRRDSQGAYGIQDLLSDLSKKYGKDKPFKDEVLFDEIFALTKNEALKKFFEEQVRGSKPLPIVDLFPSVGLAYEKEGETMELSPLGFDPNSGLGFDAKRGKLKVERADEFGQLLGLKKGDLLNSWNGVVLELSNLEAVLGAYMTGAKEGDALKIGILRMNEEGVYQDLELSGTLAKVKVKRKHIFSLEAGASQEAQALRKAWLGQ